MNHKWNEGKKKAEMLRPYAKAAGKSDVFAALDGENKAAYGAVYKNKEFIASRMNLDKADETKKALTRISEATARGVSLADAIEMERKNDPKGKTLNWDKMDKIKETNDMNAFIKMRDDNAKAVAGMEKVHESIRKQYQEDAATEDQLKFVKYNEIDPTEPTKKKYDKTVEQEEHDEKTDDDTTVDESTTKDDTTTDSSTTEGSNPTSSTNTENVENNSFEPIYRDLDEQLQAAYEGYAQYGDISGTADDAAKREEIEKQIKDLHNKKIDDKIRILQAELVQYDGIAMTPEDIKKQNEILEEIAKLQRQKR